MILLEIKSLELGLQQHIDIFLADGVVVLSRHLRS